MGGTPMLPRKRASGLSVLSVARPRRADEGGDVIERLEQRLAVPARWIGDQFLGFGGGLEGRLDLRVEGAVISGDDEQLGRLRFAAGGGMIRRDEDEAGEPRFLLQPSEGCLLYTSDAADE